VRFDHDFIGREALAKMGDAVRRKKVTLAWNGEDVTRAFGDLFVKGDAAKYIDLPLANYSTLPYDKVLKGRNTIGVSTYTGYSHNERSMLSLAIVDVAHSEPGTEVTLVWGENTPSSKVQVEDHEQVEIRATVMPAPLVEQARTVYRSDAGVK
jgi:glycine cleavage system aminomethyltransferase T